MPRSFKAKKVVVSCEKLGGEAKEETPVIIPNTEVKLLFADGTASSRESKLLPGFLFYTLNIDFIFYVFRCSCF